MVIDKNVKVGVIASLIATALFIYFIDPILTIFGRTLLQFASRLYSSYVDHLFEKIALCSAVDPAFVLFSLTMGFVSGISTGVCTGIIVSTIMKKKEKPPTLLANMMKPTPTKAVIFGLSFILLTNFFTFFLVWDSWFQLKTISSFQQHMIAVTPYLEDREEKMLWSQWTQMRSRQDYDVIYARLKTVATAHGLRLPENKAYTTTSI